MRSIPYGSFLVIEHLFYNIAYTDFDCLSRAGAAKNAGRFCLDGRCFFLYTNG
nr:MAG TPA: hypothetical protein [Caudoviricetes sp.]